MRRPTLCGLHERHVAPADRSAGSEAESFSSVTEQRVKRRPIQAQGTAIARAMARIDVEQIAVALAADRGQLVNPFGVAGVLAPLVMHSALGLALASAGLMSIGIVAWLWVKPQLQGLSEG